MKKIKYCSEKRCFEVSRMGDKRILVSAGCEGKHCGGSINMFLTEAQADALAKAILEVINKVEIHI